MDACALACTQLAKYSVRVVHRLAPPLPACSAPELVRNVAVVGHLHHGKTLVSRRGAWGGPVEGSWELGAVLNPVLGWAGAYRGKC